MTQPKSTTILARSLSDFAFDAELIAKAGKYAIRIAGESRLPETKMILTFVSASLKTQYDAMLAHLATHTERENTANDPT